MGHTKCEDSVNLQRADAYRVTTRTACYAIAVASTGGWAQRELHPEGGRIHSVFVHKSETLDSCRFETKMRQNAPNRI